MRAAIAAALLTLAGCGLVSGPAQMPDLRASITRAQIDRAATALMLAEIPARAAAATLTPAGENGGVVTWRTADNVTLSFRDGVLVASRGLGDDLISADVTGTLAALSGGPASGYARLHSYLDGESRTVFRTFLCEMSPPASDLIESFGITQITTRWTETCYSTRLQIENTYWLAPDGTMWRARQWIGPGPGVVTTELLRR